MKDFISNCLAVVCPDLCLDWHPTKNLPLTIYNCSYGSCRKIWWKCHSCNYEWECHLTNRRQQSKFKNGSGGGTSCPNCSGRARTPKNSFKAKNPEIAKEWKTKDNLPFKVNIIAPTNKKKYIWKCKNCGNEWVASCASRNNNTDCSTCQGRKHP